MPATATLVGFHLIISVNCSRSKSTTSALIPSMMTQEVTSSAFFIILYVICSQLCESGIFQEKMPPALLLMMNIFVVAILAVTSPALMVLFNKLAKLLLITCQTRCKATSVKVIPVVEFPHMHCKNGIEHITTNSGK